MIARSSCQESLSGGDYHPHHEKNQFGDKFDDFSGLSVPSFLGTSTDNGNVGDPWLSRSAEFIEVKRTSGIDCSSGDLSASGAFGRSTRALKPAPRKSNDLSDLTIDKLDLKSLGGTKNKLYGRDREIKLLQQCWEQLVTCQVNRQLVLISGTSGSGKSALAKFLYYSTKKTQGKDRKAPLFAKGKFDFQQRHIPYAGIASACAEICGRILEDKNHHDEISKKKFDIPLRHDLLQGIGTAHIGLLLEMIPILGEAIPSTMGSECDEFDQSTMVASALTTAADTPTNNPTATKSSAMASSCNDRTKKEFQFAFCRFLRVILKHYPPLTLILDDLQWADMDTLELLQIILSDYHLQQLMIIGTYRSNEVDELHSLAKILEEIREEAITTTTEAAKTTTQAQYQSFYHLAEIKVECLNQDAVQLILYDLLHMDDMIDNSSNVTTNNSSHSDVNYLVRTQQNKKQLQVFDLASLCHQRTQGNPFFLLHFLAMLEDSKLLQFHLGTLSWIWDLDKIQSETSATMNVVDLLRDKLKNLFHENELSSSTSATADRVQKASRECLKIAACLGSFFDEQTLVLLWTRLNSRKEKDVNGKDNATKDVNTSDLEDIGVVLKSLEVEGYIMGHGRYSEESETLSYKWAHDKIQEAAFSLIEDEERSVFTYQVGKILMTELTEEELESAIFMVVNLLNTGVANTAPAGEVEGKTLRLQLARLNCRAGQKAISLSAFESAAEYIDKGISLLENDNCWTKQRDLSMTLFSMGAKAESVIGNADKADNYCRTIVSQENIPKEAKLEVYLTWVDVIIARGRNQEAVDLLLGVLGRFNCCFPSSMGLIMMSVLKSIIRIKSQAKKMDVEKIPKMNDPTRALLMKILDKLSAAMYYTKDNRLPLVVFKGFHWTIKYGYCEHSPVSFATTGMILAGVLKDPQGGSKYGERALALSQKTKSSVSEARTMFLVYPALFAWTEPASFQLKPLLHAYDLGLRNGDVESAVDSIGLWIILKYIRGTPLVTLESDLHLYTRQMKDLGKDKQCFHYCIKRQGILNLMLRDNIDTPTLLRGTALSEQQVQILKEDAFFEAAIDSWEGLLLCFFGQHLQHAKRTIQNGHNYLENAHLCSPEIWWDTLLRGISCFEAAKQTGKRQYAVMGRKLRSKVKRWIALGNPNLEHYEALLDAEFKAFHGKRDVAIEKYKMAILLAGRGGHQQDAALASERLGSFYLSLGDREEALYRINESIKYWKFWGAKAKVVHLEREFAALLPPGSQSGSLSTTSSITRTLYSTSSLQRN